MPTRATRRNFHDIVESEALMERAIALNERLVPTLPTFFKAMIHSNVEAGFWLFFPIDFCNKHLPYEDAIIYLEDVTKNTYETKYFHKRKGLSSGWKSFTSDHNLRVGDICIFRLVSELRFKVYIVRPNTIYDLETTAILMELK